MKWSVGLLLAVTGCQSLLGIDEFQTAAPNDAADDASDAVDAPEIFDAQDCFGSLTQLCFNPPPSGGIAITTAINTNTDSRCVTRTQTGGPELCVIAGTTIAVTGSVLVTGTKPLVLVATDSITIAGTLDASSTEAGRFGAGGVMAPCSAGTGGMSSNNGGGGGAGGTFGGTGAAGGAGAGGGPGTPGPVLALTAIRGACAGGFGGVGVGGSSRGDPGPGGGALALLAGSSITVASGAGVFASGGGAGGGGQNGGDRGGGGGGGAGGLIVLEATSINVAGTVAANGGAGGGGGDASNGFAGADGTTSTFTIAALGGLNEGNGHGGPGGSGSARSIAPTVGGVPVTGGGGGGGGGGLGVIWIKGVVTGTQFSPIPTLN